MSRCGAVGTYLRCSGGFSNCESQDTQHPCTQYTVLVPIPPRGSPDPSSRAKRDWLVKPCAPALQPCPSVGSGELYVDSTLSLMSCINRT